MADDWKAIAAESERILEAKDIKGCHECLMRALESGCRHPEILWRLGRSCYEMAEESTDAEVRNKYFKEGLAYCEESIKGDDNNCAVHKWTGILLAKQNVSTKEKIANAYLIRDHFLKAVELGPNDANSQHCMGNWCWEILQVGWLERKAAALIFGEPPSSTYEECLKYLLAADKCGPTVHNSILIGDVYYQQSDYENAKKWYQAAIDLPASSELQKRNRADAQKKLAKC